MKTEERFLPGPLLVLSKPGVNFPFGMLVPWPCCTLGPRPPKYTLLIEQKAEESEYSEQTSYKTNVLLQLKAAAMLSCLYCMSDCVCVLSCIKLFATLWAIVHQAPLPMEFSRQEYWSGPPFPTPGDLPDPGIKPTILELPALVGRFFITSTTWKAQLYGKRDKKQV